MSKQFTYLVAYDISDPKLLRRVADYLEKRGRRVQKSVFLLTLKKGHIQRIKDDLFQKIGTNQHLMVIPVCQSCMQKAEFLGEESTSYSIF